MKKYNIKYVKYSTDDGIITNKINVNNIDVSHTSKGYIELLRVCK